MKKAPEIFRVGYLKILDVLKKSGDKRPAIESAV
jgi:hypothetical protein